MLRLRSGLLLLNMAETISLLCKPGAQALSHRALWLLGPGSVKVLHHLSPRSVALEAVWSVPGIHLVCLLVGRVDRQDRWQIESPAHSGSPVQNGSC